MKRVLFAILVGGFTAVSCSVEDDPTPETPYVVVPETYTFTRDGASTVDFNGQTIRLRMVKELLGEFKKPEVATNQSLSDMFSNLNAPFAAEDLNASTKSIKSKVAASQLYFASNTVEGSAIKTDFENWITEQTTEVFPNWNVVAEPGVPGQLADGESVRYVNAKGVELNQVFAKRLIGALLTDQVVNNYLTAAVLDEAENVVNNDKGVTESGKAYTTMEHKWDEAYGYVYGDPSVPAEAPNSVLKENEDHLLFHYLGSVDSDSDFVGIAEETFNAFKTGRAAIVAGDYQLRDQQVAIIQENISLVSAVRAVHYLQGGKTALASGQFGAAFHELSEGLGFVYSLRFSHNPVTDAPYLSVAEIDRFIEQLLAGNGFWEVTPETLQSISQTIAEAYGFTVVQAAQ